MWASVGPGTRTVAAATAKTRDRALASSTSRVRRRNLQATGGGRMTLVPEGGHDPAAAANLVGVL